MGKHGNKPINVTRLRELFGYDADGLYWKVNKGRAKKGDRAYTNSAGYKVLKFDGISYLEHRLVWAWHYGKCPEFIDHVDNNPRNNRIGNLRPATFSENMRNSVIGRKNTSGVKGVYWCASKQKWKAVLTFNGKQNYLGRFANLAQAAKTVEAARQKHHGDFANTGEHHG